MFTYLLQIDIFWRQHITSIQLIKEMYHAIKQQEQQENTHLERTTNNNNDDNNNINNNNKST